MIEKCERCGNEDEGARVFYCRDCETYFCDDCIGEDVGELRRMSASIAYDNFCPECSDGGYIGRVDRIGSSDDDDDDSDDE